MDEYKNRSLGIGIQSGPKTFALIKNNIFFRE